MTQPKAGPAIDAAEADLKLPRDDYRVPRYALLMVAHQRIQNDIATGEAFDIDTLLKVEAAMETIRASPPRPHSFKRTSEARCRLCGHAPTPARPGWQ
jgi:hypothetical protein